MGVGAQRDFTQLIQRRRKVGVVPAQEARHEAAGEARLIGAGVPRLLGSKQIAVPGVFHEVVVAAVAPIGVEQSTGAVLLAGGREPGDVGAGLGEPGEERVPGVGARTGEELKPGRLEVGDGLELVVVAVGPVEHCQILGDVGNQLRVVPDDVAPEHHPLAVFPGQLRDLRNVVEIDPPLAALFAEFIGLAPAEVVDLIAAGVEALAGEERQELGEETVQKSIAVRVGRRKRPGVQEESRRSIRIDVFAHPQVLGEVVVLRVLEHGGEMAEGGQRRHQLDVTGPAVGVEFQDILGRERRGVLADLRVAPEREGVLDIELELVDLAAAELVGQLQKLVQFRHAATGHIIVNAAVLEVRPVLDLQAGQRALHRLFHELAQGLESVKRAADRAGLDADAGRADAEPVAVAMQTIAQGHGDGVVTARVTPIHGEPREQGLQFRRNRIKAGVTDADHAGGGQSEPALA